MRRVIDERIQELVSERVPFVHATVVRVQVPTSARAGDDAIVLSDGSIEGFVGGVCAENSVRAAALSALQDGRTVLLRVVPEDERVEFPESPGARVVVNPCLSGGAMEIFLEPLLPPPVVCVVGESPIARALADLAAPLDFMMRWGADSESVAGASAVVVASHGRDEIAPLQAALDADAPYIGLVASRRRAAAVLDTMRLSGSQRERIHSPAGLDIGARTAPEIALSILAEIVESVRRSDVAAISAEPAESVTAVDPVCGMTVTVRPDTPHVQVDGVDYWFCNPGCRDTYAERVSA
jgi:xanthine dehydrogenase accessory factor